MSNPTTNFTVGDIDLSNIFQPYKPFGGLWVEQTDSGSRNWFSIASSSSGENLVAVVNNGYIYTSSNAGTNWTQRYQIKNYTSVASTSDGSKLIAVTDNDNGYVYISSNSGIDWNRTFMYDTQGYTLPLRSVASSRDGTILLTGIGGNTIIGKLFRSINSGANWSIVGNTTPGDRLWIAFALSGDGKYCIAAIEGEALWRSSNFDTATASNVSFSQVEGGPLDWRAITSTTTGEYFYAAVNNSYIYRSSNYGATWFSQTNSGIRNWNGIACSSNGQTVAATDYNGYIYISTNNGVDWSQLINSGSRLWTSIASSDDSLKLAATNQGGFIYTYDGNSNPTGYEISDGTDLNKIFAPYTGGTKAITTGYIVDGIGDLNDIFAKKIDIPYIITTNTTGASYTETVTNNNYRLIFNPKLDDASNSYYSDASFNIEFLTNLSVTISVIGGGGGGRASGYYSSTSLDPKFTGAGGGGGSFAKGSLSVSSGNEYSIVVGAGGKKIVANSNGRNNLSDGNPGKLSRFQIKNSTTLINCPGGNASTGFTGFNVSTGTIQNQNAVNSSSSPTIITPMITIASGTGGGATRGSGSLGGDNSSVTTSNPSGGQNGFNASSSALNSSGGGGSVRAQFAYSWPGDPGNGYLGGSGGVTSGSSSPHHHLTRLHLHIMVSVVAVAVVNHILRPVLEH